jgi:putative membrane protein
MLIGSGFILPGVSGGALAAVFGMYERIIAFLAHPLHNFKKNLLYVLPVVVGGVLGIFLLSFVVSAALGKWQNHLLWLFVGCILGTAPALWHQAGKEGRGRLHLLISGISFALSLALLLFGESLLAGASLAHNPATWAFAGALIGLGVLVPGLSPSNFLIYLVLYKPMSDGIKALQPGLILPLVVGAAACVLLFSKLINRLFERAYAGLFHAILGIVFASTVMIIPRHYKLTLLNIIIALVLLVLGAALGYWMSALEEKYQ